MQLQKTIEQLGYKPNEAKVYLAILSLGESTSSDVAKKAKLPRTSTQVILDKLHMDGLVDCYTKRRYKYWVAEEPQKLVARLEERQMLLKSALPKLDLLRKNIGEKPKVKVYSGVPEIKLIHEDILSTKQPICAVIPWAQWVEVLGEEFMNDFIKSRVEHFLRIKLLIPESAIASKLKEEDSREMRVTRFLPKRIDIKDTIFIYGNKVAIVSLNKKQPTGILIEDPDTCYTMKVFFEEIWGQSN